MAKYLQGALAAQGQGRRRRLQFFFNYLDNADVEISNDAYKEFGNADYKDFRGMAKDLPADKIAKWLQDPKTPAFRFGLYASMLGHCGKEEHADVLREMLDDPDKRRDQRHRRHPGRLHHAEAEGRLGVPAQHPQGPDEGVHAPLRGLRAVRFFWDSRPDVVAKKDVVEAIGLLLDQSDIADLAIEDLRKWQHWDMADAILALHDARSRTTSRSSAGRSCASPCAARQAAGGRLCGGSAQEGPATWSRTPRNCSSWRRTPAARHAEVKDT